MQSELVVIRMAETTSITVGDHDVAPGQAVNTTAVFAGGVVGALVNLNALLIPLLAVIGGGIVAGFVGGYVSGGLVRGPVHGALAGAVTGAATGAVLAITGGLLGLYTEPPTLIGRGFDVLVSPMVTGVEPFGPLLVLVLVTFVVAFDGLVAGLAGGVLRDVVDRASGRAE